MGTNNESLSLSGLKDGWDKIVQLSAVITCLVFKLLWDLALCCKNIASNVAYLEALIRVLAVCVLTGVNIESGVIADKI